MNRTVKVAILGSGNIGTDLMYKILKKRWVLELSMIAGIDPQSEGLARARAEGVYATAGGIDAILEDPEIKIVFDATSAKAHLKHAKRLKEAGKVAIDLTPAAVGPYVVPPVNLMEHVDKDNVNLITCGGQATIPLVYAVSRVANVKYAEMVSTVSSSSAGPGTRQNIDEFTFTTSRGLEVIGGAEKGKAIIILNPAKPPILMRNTVYIAYEDGDDHQIRHSIGQMIHDVQQYVPGYRLKGEPIFDRRETPKGRLDVVILLLEVEGAGDFLPVSAGNLDIMTASAKQVGEVIAKRLIEMTSTA
ncbi:acetaldehyde dehydrogenase [Geobacillus genomosp. 3]|uniref:Acetaldehyde dehydrogenase n=2 Tax=Geobacillus genomosp. 3 TaxID=1921421 RepID=ACDH_GEOG3|nr:acetaldehyde dehydrogenase (acetylating) [Geobacillus genomosp. 3]Q764S1.1 RecName: Full=Acetaldehyde dehydrogenase; AltName: Full=Acetaldehyde dehydrogenase [acetylating] [Geobacillus genomosp. 3]AGT32687.1 acetaldehyde dehydrogenase [Geobacillus genomosp. 3]BAD08310.1 acetaldehyde dehydrogenase [Geobacillus genomosp. 3]